MIMQKTQKNNNCYCQDPVTHYRSIGLSLLCTYDRHSKKNNRTRSTYIWKIPTCIYANRWPDRCRYVHLCVKCRKLHPMSRTLILLTTIIIIFHFPSIELLPMSNFAVCRLGVGRYLNCILILPGLRIIINRLYTQQ